MLLSNLIAVNLMSKKKILKTFIWGATLSGGLIIANGAF